MVIAARLSWLREQVNSGRCCIFSIAVHSGKVRVKITLLPLSGETGSPVLDSGLQCIKLVESLCAHYVVVDRGHGFSSGVSRVTLWLTPAPVATTDPYRDGVDDDDYKLDGDDSSGDDGKKVDHDSYVCEHGAPFSPVEQRAPVLGSFGVDEHCALPVVDEPIDDDVYKLMNLWFAAFDDTPTNTIEKCDSVMKTNAKTHEGHRELLFQMCSGLISELRKRREAGTSSETVRNNAMEQWIRLRDTALKLNAEVDKNMCSIDEMFGISRTDEWKHFWHRVGISDSTMKGFEGKLMRECCGNDAKPRKQRSPNR